MGLFTMYNIAASIGVSKALEVWTYAALEAGIENLAEALNEVVAQYQFFEGAGFATNHVNGMAPAYTVTGRRVLGDAAQDYIFGKKYELGANRDSSLKLVYTNGAGKDVTIVCDITICNIQEFSGATTDDSAISFELRPNAKPTVTVET